MIIKSFSQVFYILAISLTVYLNFQFYLAVRYFVTVKVGEHSPAQFLDTLNINIVAKSYATGFIKLDKSIAYLGKTKDERAKSHISTNTNTSSEESKAREKLKLFQSGKGYVFLFEDKDIRTVNIKQIVYFIQ
jgi:hypothetical protein